MKKNNNFYFYLVIFIISFVIRYISIQTTPLLWDEASLGYNAYSILKTGRDEYGTFLPIIFKSFGDYKPGLYVYLCLPFVYILGLNELSVRLPSIIFSLPNLFSFPRRPRRASRSRDTFYQQSRNFSANPGRRSGRIQARRRFFET